MELAKKLAQLVAVTLFTFFLSTFVILLSVYNLTSPGTLKPVMKAQVDGQIKQMEEACARSPNLEFNIQGRKVSCGGVKSIDAESVATELFDKSYYKNYTCSLADCVKPEIIASSFGNSIVYSIVLISIVMTIVFGAVFLLLLDQKIKGFGVALIFVGINYFVLAFANGAVPAVGIAAIDSMITSLLGQMATNFLYVLIAGVVLAAAGFVTKK